jgi:hypothetical protein
MHKITIPYFLCRPAKPIAALSVAAKTQILCEKVFFTLQLSFPQTAGKSAAARRMRSACKFTNKLRVSQPVPSAYFSPVGFTFC